MEYHCVDCDMTITGLACAKCNTPLVHDQIDVDGKKVQVSKCPNSHGKIKSPQCCGHDMEVKH